MDIEADERITKVGEMNKPLGFHNFILQKTLTGAIFLVAPAANMLHTSRFPFGCMKWQHAGILESICKIKLIIFFFSV